MDKQKNIKIPDGIKEILEWMLTELQNERLSVVLVPSTKASNVGGKIRSVENRNPIWYQDFCSGHSSDSKSHRIAQSRGKFKTKIKRQDTISILKYMIKTGSSHSGYAEELFSIAQDEKIRWDNEYGIA